MHYPVVSCTRRWLPLFNHCFDAGVVYGTSPSSLTTYAQASGDSARVVTILGLAPQTTYYYSVVDGNSNVLAGPNSFTTNPTVCTNEWLRFSGIANAARLTTHVLDGVCGGTGWNRRHVPVLGYRRLWHRRLRAGI